MNLAHLAPGGAGVWPLFAVVASGGGFAVVLGHAEGAAVVAAITHKRSPAHRSDVQVDDIADLVAMALPGGTYLIRTANRYRQTTGVVVGTCPLSICQAIARAAKHEADGRAMEAKYREATIIRVPMPRSHGRQIRAGFAG